MKSKTLRKLLITFSAVGIVSIGIGIACSDDGDYYGYSNFTPETFVDPSFSEFFYDPYNMFYGGGHDDDHISRFNDQMIANWKGFLNRKLSTDNLKFFLLNKESPPVVNELYKFIANNTKTGTYNEWSAKIDLTNREVKAFIEFLYWAKIVEISSLSRYDYWDYETKEETPKVESSVIDQLKLKYQQTTNNFLKNRYWFQVMKAYFYSNKTKDAQAFFEKTNKTQPRNTLYYRVLSYLAGISYKSGDYAKSNYLYSIVFNNCTQLRKTAMYSFHPQNESDWIGALKLAGTDSEKANLWALLGYYNDEERAIKEIFKLDPQNINLNFLVARLINKIELKFDSYGYNSLAEHKEKIKENIDENTVELITHIALSKKTVKPYLWYTAAGYLQTLSANYTQASELYSKAEEIMPQKEVTKSQLRLLKFVNTLSAITEIDKEAENKLLTDLKWLYFELPKKAPDEFRYEKATNWSKAYLSQLYASKHDVIMSELFSPVLAFYKDNQKIEQMKMFLEKPEKTPFENLAQDVYRYSIEDIYEFQAVMATFNNEIDLAMKYMSKAGSAKDELLLGNPFNGFIKDCHDCDHAARQSTKFSKLRFIEIIQIMQGKVKNGEDLYNNYLLLGNSFYNMTYYGNARVFYEGNIVGEGTYIFDDLLGNKIYDMTNAKYYYQKASETATNNEQRAKCNYLLAKCERNEYYNDTGNDNFLAWKGFQKLKEKYSNTKYYKEVIKECGYFKKYAGN